MGKELLGRLITDLRMARVWATLRKKIKEETEFFDFWDQCQRSILGWLAAQKRTAKEREDHFRKIHNLALELSGNCLKKSRLLQLNHAGIHQSGFFLRQDQLPTSDSNSASGTAASV
jgi:hypothetical protein